MTRWADSDRLRAGIDSATASPAELVGLAAEALRAAAEHLADTATVEQAATTLAALVNVGRRLEQITGQVGIGLEHRAVADEVELSARGADSYLSPGLAVASAHLALSEAVEAAAAAVRSLSEAAAATSAMVD